MHPDGDDGPILDAALELFGEVGIPRTTIGDVAKRARINRVTVYRRIGSKDDLVRAVMARESSRLFVAVAAAASQQASRADRAAHGFATTIDSVRTNPVLLKMFDSESSLVLEQLTTNASALLAPAINAAAHIARGELESDTFAVPDAPEIVVRVVHSILLTPSAAAPLDTYDDLLAFAHRNIVPLLVGDSHRGS
ncbi:TetR/AcrR family transcriptional regulator [Rhodococcus sp. 05-340-1]|jgi:AcrR family transcriptional regulator|uniref:TetR/AcrR family transcriptional regulator n=1 Tax=Nocardiaceae TaxID=85025 RepID=UPI0005694B3E|nr:MULTISPECIES: TetR/AcrR family transcriptional regulator [Rhodococcus]OZD67462.1 TetR/AcrR family transcriptional regulator [Rhodococcus sp. 05-340-2]OZD71911.1 TetR/AcrR family transcriptional regulator [Rhodococcus sp. 05-340-1]OZE93000.1 TetR/AcrR family transcriptional regulator [Rhodococcus sp. 15-2388-1-1a]OZF34352.1 TetR/AcrR family transcriptional regulator [Rhodococcus sp. 14-2483-1-2]